MKFPLVLDKKQYLISGTNGQIDKIKLINDAFELFIKDFVIDKVFYKGIKVGVRNKLLDCSVCNNNCNNDFCTCNDCPWKDKLDIFQHITTDEDKDLKKNLTKKAQQKLKKRKKTNPAYKIRTPGLFSKSRTIRILYIKFLIENIDNNEIVEKISKTRTNEDKIKIYCKKQDFLVILSKTKLENGNFEIFLNSAYHKPYISLLRDF